jgi:hypothetical protein
MYCDYDPAEFYTHHEPVARKRHQCVECLAPIEKGERHFAYSGKWDGSISTGRQHLLCMEACMLIRDKLNDECIPFGGLRDWYGEMRRDICGPDATKLRRMMAKINCRVRRSRGEAATS